MEYIEVVFEFFDNENYFISGRNPILPEEYILKASGQTLVLENGYRVGGVQGAESTRIFSLRSSHTGQCRVVWRIGLRVDRRTLEHPARRGSDGFLLPGRVGLWFSKSDRAGGCVKLRQLPHGSGVHGCYAGGCSRPTWRSHEVGELFGA